MMWLPIVGDVLSRLFAIIDQAVPDSDKARALKAELARGAQDLARQQVAMNMKEAEHPSLFVAGWRPAMGWLGVLALAYAYVVQPVAAWVATVSGLGVLPPMVALDGLYPIILGMLGLGAARTMEKTRGVARSRWVNPDR